MFTAIGETKIETQMAVCNSETVYQIFLDLRKAYDSIDRKRVLLLMEKYKIGPNIRWYTKHIWENQYFVLRQCGFYSEPISIDRGVTQGDTDSPIKFNLIVDAVIRKWKDILKSEKYKSSKTKFYLAQIAFVV